MSTRLLRINTSARTGKHASSVRTIVRKYRVLVPEYSLEIPWYRYKTGEWICGFPSETPGPLALNVSVSRVRDFCVNFIHPQFASVGSELRGCEIEGVANDCEFAGSTAVTSAVDILDHHRAIGCSIALPQFVSGGCVGG